MNEEIEKIYCILYEEKTPKNDWENDNLTFFKLHTVYKQN